MSALDYFLRMRSGVVAALRPLQVTQPDIGMIGRR